MTESIDFISWEEARDLQMEQLSSETNSVESSRWISFKGWIYTQMDLFEALFEQKKSVNTNDENPSAMK